MGGLLMFLQAMSTLVQLRNGGKSNDITRLLDLARAGIGAKGELDKGLEAAAAKVQELVDQDRALTPAEESALDASIDAHLKAIADAKTDA